MTFFEKFKKALVGAPPINSMTDHEVLQLESMIGREFKDVRVAGADSRAVNRYKNVGVALDAGATNEEVQSAVQAFVKAADTLGLSTESVPRDRVPVYTKGNTPVNSRLYHLPSPFKVVSPETPEA